MNQAQRMNESLGQESFLNEARIIPSQLLSKYTLSEIIRGLVVSVKGGETKDNMRVHYRDDGFRIEKSLEQVAVFAEQVEKKAR